MTRTLPYLAAGIAICSFYSLLISELMDHLGIFLILSLIKAPALMFFDLTHLAVYILSLANAYIPGGFLSGLLIGAKLKRRLLGDMITVSLATTIILFSIQFWLTGSGTDLIHIVFPLLGTSLGNYLGLSTKETTLAQAQNENIEFSISPKN